MIDYSEKRNFIRMPAHCPISMREFSGRNEETAQLLDLSASGMRFISPRALHAGAHLQITVRPASPITPPLEAAVAVVRCEQIANGFDIAASIVEIEPVDYPAPD